MRARKLRLAKCFASEDDFSDQYQANATVRAKSNLLPLSIRIPAQEGNTDMGNPLLV